MAGNQLRLQILTPERPVLDEYVDFVLLRTSDGDKGILHGHEPSVILLDAGILRAYTQRSPVGIYAVMGGFATVNGDEVVVMTDMAEPPDKVDEALAERERKRAENKKMEQKSNMEMHRAENALRRMMVHTDVSSYAIIRGKDGERD